MHHKKLYKQTATNAIQVWWQEREGSSYRTHSGQDGGQIVSSNWTVARPKNVGRSNETTPEQQAELEIASNYTLKLKSGYQETLSGARESDRFSPMLAKVYEDYAKDVANALASGTRQVYVQPKLDGVRCIANIRGLWSRLGNPIVSVPHIHKALLPLFEQDPSLVLDGELYNHDFSANFPALVSKVKKQKPTAQDLEDSRIIEYWVYDAPGEGDTKARVMGRRAAAVGVSGVVMVPTLAPKDLQELDEIHECWISDGFEGTMIRLEGPYEQKRSKLLLKRKECMDSEFPVIGIYEGEGNRSGMAGYAVLSLPDGRTFRANITGSWEYLRDLLADVPSYLGKEATVEYFHLTPDGIPRFPRVKVFHKNKRW
jgi:DNA ligase-1